MSVRNIPHYSLGQVVPVQETLTGRGIRVGVIDSGWDRSIQDAHVRPGVSFCTSAALSDADDYDRIGHGTACIDLVRRIASEAEIIPLRVFDLRLETSVSTLIAAIRWAVCNDVRVLNISLGTIRNDCIPQLYAACAAAGQAGVILVAAGRSSTEWSYPAVFDCVLGVGRAPPESKTEIYFDPKAALECRARAAWKARWLCGLERSVVGVSFATPIVTARVAQILEKYPGMNLRALRGYMCCATHQPIGP